MNANQWIEKVESYRYVSIEDALEMRLMVRSKIKIS